MWGPGNPPFAIYRPIAALSTRGASARFTAVQMSLIDSSAVTPSPPGPPGLVESLWQSRLQEGGAQCGAFPQGPPPCLQAPPPLTRKRAFGAPHTEPGAWKCLVGHDGVTIDCLQEAPLGLFGVGQVGGPKGKLLGLPHCLTARRDPAAGAGERLSALMQGPPSAGPSVTPSPTLAQGWPWSPAPCSGCPQLSLFTP